MVDGQFLARLRRRDPEAVEQAVRSNAGGLLNAAWGLGLARAEAEDLVADVFADFLDAAPRFEGRSSLKTFLFGILYNQALARARQKGRELATDPVDAVFDRRFNAVGHWSRPPEGPEPETLAREAADFVEQCLGRLGPLQKAAFVLKEVEGEPKPAICNALNLSDTHLRVLLFRARNKLRECLEEKWGKL